MSSKRTTSTCGSRPTCPTTCATPAANCSAGSPHLCRPHRAVHRPIASAANRPRSPRLAGDDQHAGRLLRTDHRSQLHRRKPTRYTDAQQDVLAGSLQDGELGCGDPFARSCTRAHSARVTASPRASSRRTSTAVQARRDARSSRLEPGDRLGGGVTTPRPMRCGLPQPRRAERRRRRPPAIAIPSCAAGRRPRRALNRRGRARADPRQAWEARGSQGEGESSCSCGPTR